MDPVLMISIAYLIIHTVWLYGNLYEPLRERRQRFQTAISENQIYLDEEDIRILKLLANGKKLIEIPRLLGISKRSLNYRNTLTRLHNLHLI